MTEKTIYLPIVFHFHQPVDNFTSVLEDCYNKAYEPLIENLYNFPKIKAGLHFSGNLLEWFIESKPEFVQKLKLMAKRGQIELIGGGFYEPIYAIIPYRDRIAQIKKLTALIKKEFNLNVNGAWLSERVWEPNYPSFLSDAGLKYVIVDDNHFRSCGLSEEDTLYSYSTEDEGKSVRVFPINEPLRYLTPWKPTTHSIEYLKKLANEKGDRIALLIDDAEKLGVWATTHVLCYKEGHWEGDNGKPFIPAFFEQIENKSWIKSITLSEYIKQFPAKNLLYLPTSSYDKMEEWVLPTQTRKEFEIVKKAMKEDENWKKALKFLRGGFWRYFLVKYPESNNMHKKMLYVREKLVQIENDLSKLPKFQYSTKIKAKIEKAWDEIYKAQCNDSYWHGMFGGVYLSFLRFSIYTHLINAEKIIDELMPIIYPILKSYITCVPIDFNKKTRMELLVESNDLNLYIDPFDGGTIFELDYKPKSYNLLNTLTRWCEAYHDEDKIKNDEIMIDRFKRAMIRLRFLRKDVPLSQLQADKYIEFGNFAEGDFKVTKNEKFGTSTVIELEKEGSVKDTDSNDEIPCSITKKVEVEENNVIITIQGEFKENEENGNVLKRIIEGILIGIDVPFFFNGEPKEFQWICYEMELKTDEEKDLLRPFEYEGTYFKAYDKTYDLNFELMSSSNTEPLKICKFPIIAYAYTDEGYKRIYQGINTTFLVGLAKNFTFNLIMKIY